MLLPSVVLDRLQRYLSSALQSGTVKLSRSASDGRVNSQDNERQISHALECFALSSEWFSEQRLKLEVAQARYWYDFAITGPDNLFLPVNVKVSAMRTSDNISSKEGVFFSLTGVLPSEVKIGSWELFCRQLAANLGKNPAADYYFMVVSKDDPGKVFWTGLKLIPELVPNGNNPPFQCHWGRNSERSIRTQIEAQQYILNVLHETFRLRAAALQSFDTHLGPFV